MTSGNPEPVLPATIGRYRVESVLGAGGMGTVYRAVDPDLGRALAIKVVESSGSDDESRARLLREAQAMAKLRHPNVVPIFDVGTTEHGIFVVMPLVEGGTLGAWMRAERRPWRDVLGRFLAAGRGLAAAHAAGLVHRDFKPDNVLVGERGEVLVADFGLAREALTTITNTGEVLGTTPMATSVIGTPAYMAPEQLRGEVVDARADQFSFSVALWEGLHGARPSESETRAVRLGARLRRTAVEERKVPTWLRQAIARGLAHDPAARWPSVAALLDHVERRLRRPRRIAIGAGAGALSVVAAALLLIARDVGDRAVACDRAGDTFDTVWTADRRSVLETAFATARVYGSDAAHRTTAAIDSYGDRWQGARIDACRATHERGEQSQDLLDRRMRCLDRELGELDALLAVLAGGAPEAVDKAVDAVGALPAPERCAAANLADALPVPDDPRAADVSAAIAAARAALLAGQNEGATTKVREARAGAEALGHSGLLAEARYLEARLVHDTDPARAQQELERALVEAVRAGDKALEAIITVELLQRASDASQRAKIESLLPVARAAVGRVSGDKHLEVEAATTEAESLLQLGKYDEALGLCERVTAIDASRRFDAAICRCAITANAQRLEEAAKHCPAAVAIAEETLGPTHPRTAMAIRSVASVANRRGQYAESLALREKTLAIYESTYGPDSDLVADTLRGISLVLMNLGRAEDAKARLERVAAIDRRNHATPTRGTADTHDLMARALTMLGDTAGSLREGDEALRAAEQALGPDHPEMAMKLLGHGFAYLEAKKAAIALASFDRGVRIAEAKLGSTHALLGALLVGQCQALLELRRPDEALPPCERSVQILDGAGGDPADTATAHASYGWALRDTGARSRAREEIRKARDTFAKLGDKPNLAWANGLLKTVNK